MFLTRTIERDQDVKERRRQGRRTGSEKPEARAGYDYNDMKKEAGEQKGGRFCQEKAKKELVLIHFLKLSLT